MQPRKQRIVTYRSYRNFNEKEYLKDLSYIPFQIIEVFNDIEDAYWMYEKLLKNVIDTHAPIKFRYIRHNMVPYMNGILRKAINVRKMLWRKYLKCKTNTNWENYRQQRNMVVSLTRQSKAVYINKACKAGSNSRDFWANLKPFMSNKCAEKTQHTVLLENGSIVNNQTDVCNILNDYYIDVTKTIGEPDTILESDTFLDIIQSHQMDESVRYISSKIATGKQFSFSTVSGDVISTKLKQLDVNKATGFDQIPPKLLKKGSEILYMPVCNLINKTIQSGQFPNGLKAGEVTPIFKKGDMLDKKNYRPISVLPCMSKIFESVLVEQLSEFFKTTFSKNLSGYRKRHSCESILLKLVEDCKHAVDNNRICATILTDFSKAFDSLPYKLLISKLHAYGITEKACQLIINYFSHRKQRVKLGQNKSEWAQLLKGAPQGSLFGPFMFNVYQNDLLILMEELCNVYNYADDTSVACYGDNMVDVYQRLQHVISVMLKWCRLNYLKANLEKFQFIVFHSNMLELVPSININDMEIHPQKSVRLLGIQLDDQLNFNEHIGILCKKAGRQLSILARLSKKLSTNAKSIMFHTFLLCHFNYCQAVWHFCSIPDMKKVEKIQHRALRYVCNDFISSYHSLRLKCDRPLLFTQRLRSIITEVHKICYGISPVYLRSLISIKERKYETRNVITLNQPLVRTVRYGLNSVRYQASKIWNNLCNDLKLEHNYCDFKRLIGQWNGEPCNCSFCRRCILNQL